MLSHADRKKLAEARAQLVARKTVIAEAISQSDLEAGLRALSHLRRVDMSAVPTLKRAIGAAVDEVNRSLGDERGLAVKAFDVAKRAFQALRDRSTQPLKNPIARALDITSAIKSGFDALPKILEANVPESESAGDKTLVDSLVGKSELLEKVLAKAFRCKSGAFDSEEVAGDLMQMKVSAVIELAKRVSEAAREATRSPSAARPTQTTTPAEPTRASSATNAARPTNDDLTAALERIKRASGVAPQQFKSVMNAIAKNGWKLAKR